MHLPVGRRNPLVCRFTRAIAGPLLSPFFSWNTEGHENLPECRGFVLLPKHQRWEDIPFLSLATPRPLYYMAKYELFLNSLFRWVLTAMGGLPVNRERPMESRESLRMMARYLEQGEGIVIFPEGTYHANRMGPGRVGLIRMIQSRLAVPFIPVGIRYAREGIRTSVQIRFGEPLEASAGDAGSLFRRVMGEIARLSDL